MKLAILSLLAIATLVLPACETTVHETPTTTSTTTTTESQSIRTPVAGATTSTTVRSY
jgi:hypothetical protein